MADAVKASGSAELIPPEGRRDVAKRVFELLGEVIEDRKDLGLHDRWNRHYEMIRGKHWAKKTGKVPLVTANMLYLHQQRTVNALTDNNPAFDIAHLGESETPAYDQDAFNALQRTAHHWWIDQEQQDVFEASVRNGETYGIAIEKVVFNPDLEYGIGEVETVVVDPFHFGFYPTRLRDPRELQKADAVFHFYPMSLREARRRWPGKKIVPDQELIQEIEDNRRDVGASATSKPAGMTVSVANTIREVLNWKGGNQDNDEEVVVVECWCHDYTEVTERVMASQVDSLAGMAIEIEQEETRPKYPGNIRYIVSVNGETILEDRPNPNINEGLEDHLARRTYLYDKYPFCAVNSVKDTSSAWGRSDVEQLEWLNIELDKALSQLVLEKDRASRRKIINPKDTGVQNHEFTNVHGILNPATSEASKAIRYLDFPALPVDIQNAITLFKDLFLQIAGTFDLDQAQVQGREVIAYKAIAALIERAATMMRGKIRSYGRLLRERGRMYLSHVQNFYTEDRWITYIDTDGIQKAQQIRGNELIVPAKLTVVSGSTLPSSKVQQREEAIALYQMGAIDREELLTKLDWSGRNDVLTRMQQGPVGAVLQNLQASGVPNMLLQYFQQVASMKPKELQREIKSGAIPPFPALLQKILAAMSQQQGPQEQAIPPDVQAEIQERVAEAQRRLAEAERIKAETALTLEKINTERVEQAVKSQGVDFDKEKLKIERARTVAEITRVAKEWVAKPPMPKVRVARRPRVATPTPAPIAPTSPEPPPVVPQATAKPAGYNEIGLSSNNQEV